MGEQRLAGIAAGVALGTGLLVRSLFRSSFIGTGSKKGLAQVHFDIAERLFHTRTSWFKPNRVPSLNAFLLRQLTNHGHFLVSNWIDQGFDRDREKTRKLLWFCNPVGNLLRSISNSCRRRPTFSHRRSGRGRLCYLVWGLFRGLSCCWRLAHSLASWRLRGSSVRVAER